jgi:hypothetical protein
LALYYVYSDAAEQLVHEVGHSVHLENFWRRRVEFASCRTTEATTSQIFEWATSSDLTAVTYLKRWAEMGMRSGERNVRFAAKADILDFRYRCKTGRCNRSGAGESGIQRACFR